jgi:hypothetical protein
MTVKWRSWGRISSGEPGAQEVTSQPSNLFVGNSWLVGWTMKEMARTQVGFPREQIRVQGDVGRTSSLLNSLQMGSEHRWKGQAAMQLEPGAMSLPFGGRKDESLSRKSLEVTGGRRGGSQSSPSWRLRDTHERLSGAGQQAAVNLAASRAPGVGERWGRRQCEHLRLPQLPAAQPFPGPPPLQCSQRCLGFGSFR